MREVFMCTSLGRGGVFTKKYQFIEVWKQFTDSFFLICEKLLFIFNETNDAVIIHVESHLSDLLMR